MSKLREESGIEKLFCDDLISYLADNPWIKKGDLKGNYKSTLCVLFNNDFNDLKKEIGCPVFFKKTDNTDKILKRIIRPKQNQNSYRRGEGCAGPGKRAEESCNAESPKVALRKIAA